MLGFIARAFVYPCAAPYFIVPDSLRVIPSVQWWWWWCFFLVRLFVQTARWNLPNRWIFGVYWTRERPFNWETRFNSVTHCIFATWQIGTLRTFGIRFFETFLFSRFNPSHSLCVCLSLGLVHTSHASCKWHTQWFRYLYALEKQCNGGLIFHTFRSLSPLSLLIFVVVASFKYLECHIAPILCVIYLVFCARFFFHLRFAYTREFILSSWKNVGIIRNFWPVNRAPK